MAPRTIHMIYFPWDGTGKLLKDQHDFDHRPCENMVRYASGFEVMMWTFGKAEEFCGTHYPEIWDLMQTLAHPTMMVDVLRWLVIWHFGGIYWQYDMNPLAPMFQMLPSKGKEAKVFTEFVADSGHCGSMAAEPIRNGEPEEGVRILNQCFSAIPRQRFIRKVLDLILERSRTLVPKKDYDILYICANAAVSTAYDWFGKHDPSVERISREQTRTMMKIDYKGTWRTDGNRKPKPSDRRSETGDRRPGGRDFIRAMASRVKCVPGVRPFIHRFVKPHVHEKGLKVAASPHSGKRPLGGGAADVAGYRLPRRCTAASGHLAAEPPTWQDDRASCFVLRASLVGVMRELGIRSVLEYSPSGISVLEGERVPGIDWHVTSPVRHVIHPNRNLNPNPNRTDYDYDCDYERNIPAPLVSFLNPMYSRLPQVDAVLLLDYFDQIPNADIHHIVNRVRHAGIRWLLATHYPCLNRNWDTYVGEWRPISLTLPPYSLPEPEECIPDPDAERRPDRSVGLWRMKAIGRTL